MPLQIGFVGAGNRAMAHYESVAAADGARVAAVCDLDAERREKAIREYGGEPYADHERLLAAEDLDAVYVVMSPHLLEPMVTDALERGANVFTEKPPGVDAAQTRRWADLAAANGCTTAVGFQRRFHPLVAAARRAVTERGPVSHGVATFHKEKLDPAENDLLHDVVHVVDLLTWMGDGVREVHGHLGQTHADPESVREHHANTFAGVFEFESGGVGLLNANRTAGGRYLGFEMHGRAVSAHGEIHGDADLDRLTIQRDGESLAEAEDLTTADVLDGDPETPRTRADGTFQVSSHFLDSVRADEDTDVSFADTAESMTALENLRRDERFPTAFDADW
jgi:predicted dehydrogenase